MQIQSLEALLAVQGNAAFQARSVLRSRPSFIPIQLTGGIGDVIMAIEPLRYLKEKFELLVYTPHLEAFQYFCLDIRAHKEMPFYDWHLELDTVARFKLSDQFHGFLIKEHEELFEQQQRLFHAEPAFKILSDHHPDMDATLAVYARQKGFNRRQAALYSLGFEQAFHPDRHSFIGLWPVPKDHITIHDGYDTTSKISGRSTKQWKLSHWQKLVRSLKKKYPSTKIIQLGSTTSRPIDGVDECMINRTTLTEAFNIIEKSKLHIDGDSGLVHAATRMGVPCVVLFGSTPDCFYGYLQNINLRSGVCKEACYWINKDWMQKCPIGYKTPKCLDEIQPDQVFEACVQRLHLEDLRDDD